MSITETSHVINNVVTERILFDSQMLVAEKCVTFVQGASLMAAAVTLTSRPQLDVVRSAASVQTSLAVSL